MSRMTAEATLHIEGASRFDFDGIQGVKVFASQEADPNNTNVIGREVLEFSCGFDLFESMRSHGFPGDFQCLLEFGRASKGKAGTKIVGIRPAKATPSTPAKAAA